MAKSPEAFRTISEAAHELGVAQHVLRFWESRFTFIRPTKTAGGRRFYRPADLAILATIRRLLHQDGYTIKGVQKLHKEQGLRGFLGVATERASNVSIESRGPIGGEARTGPFDRRRFADILGALEAAKTRLDAAMNDR